MRQATLASLGFERFGKTTRRATFVAEMDKVVPWKDLCRMSEQQEAAPNIRVKSNRKHRVCFSRSPYRDRNRIEWFFCRMKQFRRVATCYEKLAAN